MRAVPEKLAILAGGGPLPRDVAAACTRRRIPYFLVDLDGAAGDWATEQGAMRVALGQVGRLLDRMKAEGCDGVTMVGTLARPQLSKVRFDWQGMKVLPRVAKLFRKGDDALLSGIAAIFEEHGFQVYGADAFVGEAVADEGLLTRAAPGDDARADIAQAAEVLRALGAYDVGQAVVVADGVCLAVEAAEGTAQMLSRVAGLRRSGERSGVLVKLPKPGQDRRVDLPTIGPDTVKAAIGAKLAGIAVEAGGGFIVDPEETIRLCEEAGLFLTGLAKASE